MSAGRIDFPCTVELGRGLEGAITNVTRIGHVDGEEGKLILRGYSIEDLCAHASFEEVAHLLLFGELPSGNDLAEFEQKLRESADLPEPVIRLIESMPPDAHPMNVLQSAVAALACYDKECQAVTRHTSDPAKALPVETEVAIRVLARTRTAASAIARARMGKPPLEPVPGLSFTGNYLYMMNGERPDEMTERVMELALIMQADHGMSTSTFTAMVVHSTLSDLYSTIAAAIGSLRGPLHGGAYEAALADLMTIGSPDNVERWVEKRMASGQRIIGFGHRVYRTHDPRVGLLKRRAEALCRRRGLEDLFKTAAKVDKTVCAAMAKKGRKIFPNISFYSGVLYHALGIAPPLFPVVFAVARTAGWLARVLEYLPENRLFCPTAAYAGPADRPYVPIDRR
ncbi:MAG: citrate synthase/methylcitrate synthase [Phycisphaerae bacterium]|nr:citrate synthase/methylcitrate synthase [Phycisphaerae bacterium]